MESVATTLAVLSYVVHVLGTDLHAVRSVHAVDHGERTWIDQAGALIGRGAADHAVAGDTGPHREHARDRPMILAGAGSVTIVEGATPEVGRRDHDQVSTQLGLRERHQVVDAEQQLGELQRLVAIVVGVRVEAAQIQVGRDGDARFEGGNSQLRLLHHALQVSKAWHLDQLFGNLQRRELAIARARRQQVLHRAL